MVHLNYARVWVIAIFYMAYNKAFLFNVVKYILCDIRNGRGWAKNKAKKLSIIAIIRGSGFWAKSFDYLKKEKSEGDCKKSGNTGKSDALQSIISILFLTT